MNITLWVLQSLLALHTIFGAIWKFSNSSGQTMPSLEAIPHGVWLGMAVIEILCSVALVLPAMSKSLAILIPVAALYILAEMLLYSGLNIFSGGVDVGSLIYWLVVAAFCAFIAYGRLVLKPL
ncbi:MAG TPA: hypothetical protein VKA08_02225 [Balneolales bacterium]|nr:hypothetical protein [Balneolales bacterium]